MHPIRKLPLRPARAAVPVPVVHVLASTDAPDGSENEEAVEHHRDEDEERRPYYAGPVLRLALAANVAPPPFNNPPQRIIGARGVTPRVLVRLAQIVPERPRLADSYTCNVQVL